MRTHALRMRTKMTCGYGWYKSSEACRNVRLTVSRPGDLVGTTSCFRHSLSHRGAIHRAKAEKSGFAEKPFGCFRRIMAMSTFCSGVNGLTGTAVFSVSVSSVLTEVGTNTPGQIRSKSDRQQNSTP